MKKNSLSKHAAEPLLKLCYLTLLELSGDEEKEVTYQNLSDRFFINNKTARRIIALLENFVSEPLNESIVLDGYSYDALQRNPVANPFYMPRLRLTVRETKALISALISTGLEHNDDILKKFENYASINADINEILKQNYTAEHTSKHSITPWKIAICCLSKKRFTFQYRKSDGSLKDYIVDPLYVMHKDGRWYINAWDIEDDKQKFFVLSKMKNLAPLNMEAEKHDYRKLNSFTFPGEEYSKIRFKEGAYYDIISHSSLESVEIDGTDIVAIHDASAPDWSAKLVAASEGKITTSNTKVKDEARRYASSLIEKAKSL